MNIISNHHYKDKSLTLLTHQYPYQSLTVVHCQCLASSDQQYHVRFMLDHPRPMDGAAVASLQASRRSPSPWFSFRKGPIRGCKLRCESWDDGHKRLNVTQDGAMVHTGLSQELPGSERFIMVFDGLKLILNNGLLMLVNAQWCPNKLPVVNDVMFGGSVKQKLIVVAVNVVSLIVSIAS